MRKKGESKRMLIAQSRLLASSWVPSVPRALRTCWQGWNLMDLEPESEEQRVPQARFLPTARMLPVCSKCKDCILLFIKTERCGASGGEPACQCRRRRRHRFHLWVGKIPWRRAWQPAPVFLPGESHRQSSLAGYSPRGHKESDTTEVT